MYRITFLAIIWCWGSQKSKGIPEHKSFEQEHKSREELGDKESPKACPHLKSCESLYMCLCAPFIGRRREFYIPKIPSNLGNIPNVNMYTNVFYIPWFTGLISYIYKLATSSHLKPGLLRWRLWLCSFLIPEFLFHEDHRLLRLPNQIFINSPELRRFLFSELRNF
jgi:hypothetical protein